MVLEAHRNVGTDPPGRSLPWTREIELEVSVNQLLLLGIRWIGHARPPSGLAQCAAREVFGSSRYLADDVGWLSAASIVGEQHRSRS